VLLDQSGRFIQIYQGCSHLMTLEAFSFLDSCLADKSFLARATRIETLNEPHGSNLTFSFNNGNTKRVAMRLDINDFLVTSVL
jgi:hypothetical protein